VATDGSRAAGTAMRFARMMAECGRWSPEIITVMEPVPVAIADFTIATPAPEYQEAFTQSVLARIRRQAKRAGADEWPIDLEFGSVAPTITHVADQHEVDLVVVGLGHHGRLARLAGAETVARLTRLSHTPVLAVEAGLRHMPRTALVAMDFGDSSVSAAREAMALLCPPARLHLLHVRWAVDGHVMRDAEWERTYALGVEYGFERLRRELTPPGGLAVTSEMRHGGVIETMLEVAKEIGADLLVAGSHNQSLLDRLVIGSTPAQLLRASKCSVLIAPPGDGS